MTSQRLLRVPVVARAHRADLDQGAAKNPSPAPARPGARAAAKMHPGWQSGPRPGRRGRGRPKALIPQLVVAAAAAMFSDGAGWQAIVATLASAGNGVWARNTLKRHALAFLRRPKSLGHACSLCGRPAAKKRTSG